MEKVGSCRRPCWVAFVGTLVVLKGMKPHGGMPSSCCGCILYIGIAPWRHSRVSNLWPSVLNLLMVCFHDNFKLHNNNRSCVCCCEKESYALVDLYKESLHHAICHS